MNNQKEKIEQLILKSTTFTPTQAQHILTIKNKKGMSFLEQFSQSKKAITAEEALSDICKYLNIDFVSEIPSGEISSDLVKHIPIHYAKTHNILPFKENENSVQVFTSNPLDLEALNNLKLKFKKRIEPMMSFNYIIKEAINQVYEKTADDFSDFDDIQAEEYNLNDPVIDLLEANDEAPIIKLVNTILVRAVKERASDIHIEPYEKHLVVRFRVDGILFSILKLQKRFQNSITSRIKIMGKLNIAEKRLPQDGSIPLRLAGKDIDIRLNSIPTAFGERLVLRLQNRSQVLLEIDQLGFSKKSIKTLNGLLDKKYGIILVTGPTGSGKSATLYAALSQINSIDTNIITIEDPVEQRIAGIGQIQVNPKIGLTFANGLRSILRQDPDIIMVGEIRDIDTMRISINASLTGHLVLSTLHTNDSAGVFPRLIDMGCEPFLIATSLLGVISQRLVRTLCDECKEPYKPTQAELDLLQHSFDKKATIFKSVGCKACANKGYVGRTAISEILVVNDSIRSLILKQSSGSIIKKQAVNLGMTTFRDHGLEKVAQGITTIEEVLSNTQLDI